MNREMQSKLVAVLRDAMNAQGITQSDLARHIGTSSGMVSQAFSCKGQMREERWRMCCELCGVDFDRFLLTPQSAFADSSPTKGSLEKPVGATIGLPSHRAEQSRAEQSRAEQSKPSLYRLPRRRCTPCPL